MSALAKWLNGLRRPAVLAHRGASRAAPENSLAALRAAAELGADGVELDVQRCASSELVVFHDRSLARATGVVGHVSDTSLDVLRRLRLSRLGPGGAAEGIPTLEEWLEATPPHLFLNVEVKAQTLVEAEAARDAVAILQRSGRAGSCVLSSFHPAALAHAAAAGPEVLRGALVEDAPGWQAVLALGLLSRPAAVHPQHSQVTAERVRRWQRFGRKVLAWTVDDPDEAARCLDAGVDVLITNRPDVVRPITERYAR